MKKLFLLTFIFILNNAHASNYECNKELTITKFSSKNQIFSKLTTETDGGLDSYSYFLFDNKDMMIVHQNSCLMTDYYISYYYNDMKDFNVMYKNYLSIIKEINKKEGIKISQEFEGKLKHILNEEKIEDREYFNGNIRNYPFKLDRRNINLEYTFKLSTENFYSAYKNVLDTYIGLGGMP
ncbi:hypothetical protein SAMN04488136_107167 [Vibrio xiamenensis]|uniref:Uncharacterized protein n=1 Tax=Vibrio xiamenensis TaxID=861298 RepID=A0A1G7ZFA8_9VIBR|nr:hypothetical protein [Vibrio xiamenensis]SDH07305.1 hypothetical protein SAMN04488136_107167 [Vibrio xiamenensis]